MNEELEKNGDAKVANEKFEQEYDAAWQEAASSAESKDDANNADAGGEDDTELPPQDKENAEAPGTVDADVSKEHGKVESVEKALKDTKAYATKLAQEKIELERKLKAFEDGKATEKDVEAQRKAFNEAKDNLDDVKAQVYEDYPELKGLIDPIIEANRTLKREVEGLKSKTQIEEQSNKKVKALDHFNSNVKPIVLKTHKDFDSIVKDEDYWQWAGTQRPALRVAALHSPDPSDIVWAISEYKKYKASGDASSVKERQAKDREQRFINAQSLRGGGAQPLHSGKSGSNPDDYDAGWEEAGQVLAKEGVARK